MIRAAVLLVAALLMNGCLPKKPIPVGAEAVDAQCETICWTPCETQIPRWNPPDPDSPSAWDLVPIQVIDPARKLLETCELHRKACHQCLDRLRAQDVIR